jgi:hypothetical protein
MMDGLVRDAFYAPDTESEKRWFRPQMNRDLGQIAAERVFNRKVANNRYSILIERDVDVLRRCAGDFQNSGHRCLKLRSLKQTLSKEISAIVAAAWTITAQTSSVGVAFEPHAEHLFANLKASVVDNVAT